MRLQYVDGQPRRGDIIFMKTRWYINWFCGLFGIGLPHVGVMISKHAMIHILIGTGVEIVSLSDIDEYYEVWRPIGLSSRSLRRSQLLDLMSKKYSIRVMLHNALSIAGIIGSNPCTTNGHSCTTFSRKILGCMGVATSARTPADFHAMKNYEDELDF